MLVLIEEIFAAYSDLLKSVIEIVVWTVLL